jgi:hypothetical protein
VLRFDEDLDPVRATDLAGYRLVDAGRDGRLGTRDDRSIALRQATYDPATRSVTLLPSRRLALQGNHLLVVSGRGATALTDRAGNPLDGDGDGQAGGDLVRLVNRSTLAGAATNPPRARPRPVSPRVPTPARPVVRPLPAIGQARRLWTPQQVRALLALRGQLPRPGRFWPSGAWRALPGPVPPR